MMHPKKTLCQSRKLNGDVDTGCNHFCCFYMIFTASWWKIVIFIVLGLLAMSIPFVVYWYCRFYKKQDNNAVTVQQGTMNCSGSSEDQKTISPGFNESFSYSTESIRMRKIKDTVEAPIPSPRTLNFLRPPPVTRCRHDLRLPRPPVIGTCCCKEVNQN